MTMDVQTVDFTLKKQERLEQNYYAPMSSKTLKILEKLKKRLDHIDEQITEKNLKDSIKKIHLRIERMSRERVKIEKESFHLFTGGQNAAKMSPKIEEIRNKLRRGFYQSLSPTSNLVGRVKKTS